MGDILSETDIVRLDDPYKRQVFKLTIRDDLCNYANYLLIILSFLIIITLLHSLATGIVWGVLQVVTKKFNFRNSVSLDKSGNRYPWLLSLLLTLALLLAFAIPGYPKPDVANYGFLLGKLLLLTISSGLFSLSCWGRMINKPELRTLHLAIIGMLTSATGLIFLFLVGSGSPV